MRPPFPLAAQAAATFLQLLLVASLVVSAVPWSAAQGYGRSVDNRPQIVLGGLTSEIVLPRDRAAQVERKDNRDNPAGADRESIPAKTPPEDPTPQQGKVVAPTRAPPHFASLFLRPEARAPPSLI